MSDGAFGAKFVHRHCHGVTRPPDHLRQRLVCDAQRSLPRLIRCDQKPAGEPLSIDVGYNRTRLAQDDIATASATVRNNLDKTANMVIVDLGIPPGFDLLSEDLQAYQGKSASLKSGRLEKFSLTATQAILYSIRSPQVIRLR